jgi:RHS repeat-associated protein
LEHDESGLVYARNRYYSPGLGRFISEDPIGFGGGANFYAYCGNDPINFTDPLGLMAMGLYDGGGVWIGGTADSPALAFGGPTRTPAASYRCPRAEEDESSPAFDGGFVSMRSQHEGMDGKSARSRWAYHAIEKVRDQYCGAAFSFATAGLGMMAVETAEAMTAAEGAAAVAMRSKYASAAGEARVTVVGRMADVDNYAGKIGFDTWRDSAPTGAFSLEKNRAWIVERVNRGDEFWCVSPVMSMSPVYIEGLPNGYYALQELRWLKAAGANVQMVTPPYGIFGM